MNCEEVDLILVGSSQQELTAEQKRAVDRHFAFCAECRGAWRAYRELAAITIPEMRQGLRLRIAVALAARHPGRTRVLLRSLVVGGLLVAGAVAATVALQARRFFHASPEPLVQQVPAAAPISSSDVESVPVAPIPVDDVPSSGASDEGRNATASAAGSALDPYSLVVLGLPDPGIDPEIAAAFKSCYDAVVRQLAALAGLNVIAGENLAPFAGSDLSPAEIAGQLGAGNLLVLGADSQIVCSAEYTDVQTGEGRGGLLALGGPESPPDRWPAFAARLAEWVRDSTLKDAATVVTEAQATVLNTAVEDYERARALFQLRDGRDPIQDAYDAAVVAAAIQIGLTSTDARARRLAWEGVRGVRDRDLLQPLLHSLADDSDDGVRQAAALALHHFAGEPDVTDALAQVAEDRSGTDPVREAALRALMSDEELRDRALRTVLDDTLPAVLRLQVLKGNIDGRAFPVRLSEEAAEAVFEIGRSAEDASLRSDAWFALRYAPSDHRNAELMRTLLSDVVDHPADTVRAQAAWTLRTYIDDPDVRAALEQAQTDPALGVRRAARRALESVGR